MVDVRVSLRAPPAQVGGQMSPCIARTRTASDLQSEATFCVQQIILIIRCVNFIPVYLEAAFVRIGLCAILATK